MPAQGIEAYSVFRKTCDLEAGHRQLASWRASEVHPAACFRSMRLAQPFPSGHPPLAGRCAGGRLPVGWHHWHRVDGREGSWPWSLHLVLVWQVEALFPFQFYFPEGGTLFLRFKEQLDLEPEEASRVIQFLRRKGLWLLPVAAGRGRDDWRRSPRQAALGSVRACFVLPVRWSR